MYRLFSSQSTEKSAEFSLTPLGVYSEQNSENGTS